MSLYTDEETLINYISKDIPDGDHTFQTTANDELVDIDVEFVNYILTKITRLITNNKLKVTEYDQYI